MNANMAKENKQKIEKGENKQDCVFCKIANGEIPTKFIYEDDNFLVFDDINPVSDGHCLIITRKHYAIAKV